MDRLSYEVILLRNAEAEVRAHVPTSGPLTVTVSPAQGQDATVDLAIRLAGHGYSVSPHLSARQVRDRAHLAEIVGRCRDAGITGVFVVGGDLVPEPTAVRHAHDLLVRCTNSTTGSGTSGSAVIPRDIMKCPTRRCSRP